MHELIGYKCIAIKRSQYKDILTLGIGQHAPFLGHTLGRDALQR